MNVFSFIKKEFFPFLILIIAVLSSFGSGFAEETPSFMPNELNIKISQAVVRQGNVENFISSLANDLKEEVIDIDNDVVLRIVKIFTEDDPDSQLALWYQYFVRRKDKHLPLLLLNLHVSNVHCSLDMCFL